MSQSEGGVLNQIPKSARKWLAAAMLSVLIIGWLIASSATTQAAPDKGLFQVTDTYTPVARLPIILNARTPTPTATFTATATGTPPTPTATGTITPYIGITTGVSPTEAHINTPFSFTFKVKNSGTAPATSVALLFPLPTFLDITSVTTSIGSRTFDLHAATVTIGTLYPNQVATVKIVAKVNSTAQTQNVYSTVTVTYDSNIRKTASLTYHVVGTSLPGTGELPIEPDARAGPDPSLLFLSLTFALGAIFTIWYGFWARSNQQAGVKWYFSVGILLALIALGAGLVGSGWLQTNPAYSPAPPVAQVVSPQINTAAATATPELLAGFEIAPAFATDQPGNLPIYRHVTAEPLATLPSYPIPSPTFFVTPESVTETVDTSPIVRLNIPSLELDAVVKYVPWDSTLETWLIDGLHQEIAWLGGSSWPGLGSNTVLAGHVTIRDYGNGPFRYLDKLTSGDMITVYTQAKIYSYRVRQTTVVGESDLWVTDPTTNPQLTLITCTDWDSDYQLYMKRLIVFADLVKTVSLQASAGN